MYICLSVFSQFSFFSQYCVRAYMIHVHSHIHYLVVVMIPGTAPPAKARLFDESIVALSMLGTARSTPLPKRGSSSQRSREEEIWCRLVDELSWLCDYKCGGKTVTSIAVQKTVSGHVFWFASNRGSRAAIEDHLRWILSELESVATTCSTSIEKVRWRLFSKSLAFSRRRVEFYWKQLHAMVLALRESSAEFQQGRYSHASSRA